MKIISFLVLVILITSCSAAPITASTIVEISTSTFEPTRTSKPTQTSTIIPTVTFTLIPTTTLTQKITPTHTITSTPFVFDDGRRWTQIEFSKFISFVGGPIMFDPRYPEDDRVIHQTVTSIRECIGDGDACDAWVRNAYALTKDVIYPAYWCQWAFHNLSQGYGTHLEENGQIFQLRPLDEAWWQAYFLLGNPEVEPYCPQFENGKTTQPPSDG